MAKIGVFVCSCDEGMNEKLDIDSIIEYAKGLPDVVKVVRNDHICGGDGLSVVTEALEKEEIDHVVIAGCSPITYEKFIADNLEEAGLNRFLYEHANIREQAAWIHEDKDTATYVAKSLVSMAVAKCRLTEPLEGPEVEITPAALVIGGGVAGMRAALDMANSGFTTYLVERLPQLGGRAWKLNVTYPTSNCGMCCMHDCKDCRLTPKIEEVMSNGNLEVLLESEVTGIKGHIGNYNVEVTSKAGDVRKVTVGAIIITTGSKTFDANRIPEYGYENEDVVTFLDLEGLDAFKRPSNGEVPKVVNFILCVGSRSVKGGNPWCSLVCCNYSLGQAIEIKKRYPETQVFVHYMDLRAAYRGFEEFYTEARELGVTFVRGRVAQVEKVGDKLLVKAKDIDLGKMLKIKSDLVVLAVGQEPAEGTDIVAKLTHQKVGEDGFIKNVNLQFRSMEETGIFVAGCAQGPRGIRYSVGDAKIATTSAIELLKMGKIRLSPIRSQVNESICAGCGTCETMCVYNAIEMANDPNVLGKKVALVDDGACRACGVCIAACPSGAMEQKGFQNKQLNGMINAFLSPTGTTGEDI